jgi:hypothetical protein
MALPTLTPQQRTDALAKAAQVRTERSEIKGRLKAGTVTLAEILADEGDTVGKMKVTALIEALPGVGKVRAARIMADLGIAESRRVRGLGEKQRAGLLAEFAPAPA